MNGKGWYVLGTILLLIGLVPGTVSVIWGIQGFTNNRGFQRVVVPGTSELHLRGSGEYTVFHEYNSHMDGEVINSQCADLSEYEFHLHPKGRSEQKIQLETASGGTNYDFPSGKGVSRYSFQIREPGTYIFVGQRKENGNEDCKRAVLAIGQGVDRIYSEHIQNRWRRMLSVVLHCRWSDHSPHHLLHTPPRGRTGGTGHAGITND